MNQTLKRTRAGDLCEVDQCTNYERFATTLPLDIDVASNRKLSTDQRQDASTRRAGRGVLAKGPMNNAINFLLGQLKGAQELFAATLNGLTPAQLHHDAGGNTVPIAAQVAHVIVFEDMFINGLLKKGAPLFAGTPTGLSEMPPQAPPWDAWGRKVKMDDDVFQKYGMQVSAATLAHVGSLTDNDLGTQLDLSALGMGMQSVGFMLGGLVLNMHVHTGEISCLKGLQKLKGYPI